MALLTSVRWTCWIGFFRGRLCRALMFNSLHHRLDSSRSAPVLTCRHWDKHTHTHTYTCIPHLHVLNRLRSRTWCIYGSIGNFSLMICQLCYAVTNYSNVTIQLISSLFWFLLPHCAQCHPIKARDKAKYATSESNKPTECKLEEQPMAFAPKRCMNKQYLYMIVCLLMFLLFPTKYCWLCHLRKDPPVKWRWRGNCSYLTVVFICCSFYPAYF